MWSSHPPEVQMLLARERQSELRDAARSSHAVRVAASPKPIENVQGLRLRLGRIMIVVGRTLKEDDRPCPDMAGARARS